MTLIHIHLSILVAMLMEKCTLHILTLLPWLNKRKLIHFTCMAWISMYLAYYLHDINSAINAFCVAIFVWRIILILIWHYHVKIIIGLSYFDFITLA